MKKWQDIFEVANGFLEKGKKRKRSQSASSRGSTVDVVVEDSVPEYVLLSD